MLAIDEMKRGVNLQSSAACDDGLCADILPQAMLLIATGPPSTVADPSKVPTPNMQREREAPPPYTSQVSAEFNAFIARCLQMEDKDRPTAKELLEVRQGSDTRGMV